MNPKVRKLALYILVLFMATAQLFSGKSGASTTSEYETGADGKSVNASADGKTSGEGVTMSGSASEGATTAGSNGEGATTAGSNGEGATTASSTSEGATTASGNGEVVTTASASAAYQTHANSSATDYSSEELEQMARTTAVHMESEEVSNIEPIYLSEAVNAGEETECEFQDMIVTYADPYLTVYESADKSSSAQGRLYPASYGEILERGEEWTKIESGNVTGYIQNKYVCFDEEAEDLSIQLQGTLSTAMTMAEIKKAEEEAAKKKAAAAAAKAASGTTTTSATSVASNDVYLLAAIISWEANGESPEGRRAVGYVVVNRLNSGRWGNLTGVLTARGQFGGVSDGAGGFSSGFYARYLKYANGANDDCLQAAYDCLAGVNCPLVSPFMSFNTVLGAGATYYQQIGGHYFW